MTRAFPVYIVDDSSAMRAILAALCEDWGFLCRCFENGEQFLDALDDLDPGCILLDMHMPRRSGLQTQAELERRGSTMPIVAITGHGDVDMAVESMKMGALDFLEKPFEEEVLLEAIGQGFTKLEKSA